MNNEFFLKAHENLLAAQLLLEHGYYQASANRAYYAAFHAAIARLSCHGMTNEKHDHGWVQANFNNEFIHKSKCYPDRFKAYLLDLQAVRNRADYKAEMLSQKIATRQFAKAKEFVTMLAPEELL